MRLTLSMWVKCQYFFGVVVLRADTRAARIDCEAVRSTAAGAALVFFLVLFVAAFPVTFFSVFSFFEEADIDVDATADDDRAESLPVELLPLLPCIRYWKAF